MGIKNSLQNLKDRAVTAFLARCGQALGVSEDRVQVYDNSTEEIAHSIKSQDRVKLYQRGRAMMTMGGGSRARLEENYLFDTRRFASGVLAAGEYIFFASAIGQPAANNGFVAPMVMTDVETNMDTPSQIPQGKDYVLTQIGLSFNSQILTEDMALLLESGALRFEKQGGQYTLRHGVGRLWPGGTGISGFTGVATDRASSNGNADIRVARRLAVPRILKQKETFAYKYVVPRGVSNLDFSTAISLNGNCLLTIWLWGGQEDAIPV